MMKLSITSLTCLISLLVAMGSCKQRSGDGDLKAVNITGTGQFTAFYITSNYSHIVFVKVDPKTRKVLDKNGKPMRAGDDKSNAAEVKRNKISSSVTVDPVTNAVTASTPMRSQTNDMYVHMDEKATSKAYLPLSSNDQVNWGWKGEWTCADGKELVEEKLGANDSKEACLIEFNTEDERWYTISVLPLDKNFASPQSPITRTYQNANPSLKAFLTDSRYKKLAKIKGGFQTPKNASQNPLRPLVDVNAIVDSGKVLASMKRLNNQFQKTPDDKKARNTCLKNARANEWLDLQAHFYCLMPYGQHRKCYSTSLITMTRDIDDEKNPQKRLGILLNAYYTSYAKCIQPVDQRNGRGGSYALKNRADAAVFKYVMFTKQGVMDFNIESSNKVIDSFYKFIKEPRPRRLADANYTSNFPKHSIAQARYNDIRLQQVNVISRNLANAGCQKTAGTWNPATNECKCNKPGEKFGKTFDPKPAPQGTTTYACKGNPPPVAAGWDAFWKQDKWMDGQVWDSAGFSAGMDAVVGTDPDKPVLNDPKIPYSDYRPAANNPKADNEGRDIPGNELLRAMRASKALYNLQGTSSCLTTGYSPTHWSDIMIHYYCQMAQPRYCWTYALSGSRGKKMNRAQAWKHCPTDDQYGPAGFKQFVMENSKQGNIFRYIMMSASNVFKRDQQQAVINTFWDISKPTDWAYLATDAGKKECNAKRLRRQEDPRDGTHCLPSKKYSPKILGKSR